MTQFSDSDLKTYLDGRAGDDLAKRIESVLGYDDALAARLMSLDPMAAPVQDAFAGLKPPEIGSEPSRPVMMLPRVAAGITCAIAIFAAGYFSRSGPDTGWMAEVAAYQALYVAETIAIAPNAKAQAAQLETVGQAIGRDLSALLDGAPGATFKRAQILGYEGAAIAQLVFESEDGAPIALCLTSSDQSESVAFKQMKGMAAAHWSDADHAVLLIGGQDETLIKRLYVAFDAKLS